MGAATHLGISLREYDTRIRTFIPHYEEMLDTAASALRVLSTRTPRIVDLGIGTGALSARCLAVARRGRVLGIDEDAEILAMARARLGARLTTAAGDFAATPLPRADAIVASFALHHVRTMAAKQRLYRRCATALTAGGMLISADCFLSSHRRQRAIDRLGWRAHLEQSYSRRDSERYLRTWSREDVYFGLTVEVAALQKTGLIADVLWRRPPFAVIVGTKPR